MNPSSTGSIPFPKPNRSSTTTLLACRFQSKTCSDWRSGGFSEWQDRQDAADFLTNLDDQSGPNPQTSSSPSTDRMALWLSLQYALATRTLVRSPVAPPARWARLREICADIARLRRSDLFAERL